MSYALVYRFFIICALVITASVYGASVNLVLHQAPLAVREQVERELEQRYITKLTTKTPLQLAKKSFKNNFKRFFPTLSGFVALYGGFVDYSDADGSITFPLLQSKQKIYLVITPRIQPVVVHGNTISHQNFIKKEPAIIYRMERKKNKQNLLYWEVRIKNKPKHNRINHLSIVLLTKPKNIVVPTGDFITTKDPNFVLPPVFVVGNNGNTESLFDFLDIRRFYEQIKQEERIEKGKIQQLIRNL